MQPVEEGSVNNRKLSLERRYSFASTDVDKVPVSNPEWSGGVLDIWEDISLAYLSLFCTFCVFGWKHGEEWVWEHVCAHCNFYSLLFGSFLYIQLGCYKHR